MTNLRDESVIAALWRDLYSTLSGLLIAPPTPEALSFLRDSDTRQVVGALAGARASEVLVEIAHIDHGGDFRQEFFDVLSVPTSRYVAPFESVYCDDREVDGVRVAGMLAGPSALAVERDYARAGLAVLLPELPDHIGCELNFLAALAGRRADALARGDLTAAAEARAAARTFAHEHLLRWAPKLVARMNELDAVFHARVVELASALVRADFAEG